MKISSHFTIFGLHGRFFCHVCQSTVLVCLVDEVVYCAKLLS